VADDKKTADVQRDENGNVTVRPRGVQTTLASNLKQRSGERKNEEDR
jgi:hypothetical protein